MFLGFVVEDDVGGGGASGVVEEEEMLGTHEFGGVDAVLDEDETDVSEGEGCFFKDLALEGVGGGLAALDFSAGDAPAISPFVGADEEDVAISIIYECADGGDGSGGGPATVEEGAEDAKVWDGDVGPDGGKNFCVVVAGEDGDGGDATVTGGFDIVSHVADEGGLGGV